MCDYYVIFRVWRADGQWVSEGFIYVNELIYKKFTGMDKEGTQALNVPNEILRQTRGHMFLDI